MGKFKIALTTMFYVCSCIALAATHGAISALHTSYTASYPSSLGTKLPAFTSTALSLMPNTAVICFGTLVASALLLALALSRATTSESKLHWVTLLSALNYHVSTFLFGTVLIGFFLLPKLANGT